MITCTVIEFAETPESWNTVSFYCISTQNPQFQDGPPQTQDAQQQAQPEQQAQTGQVCVCVWVCVWMHMCEKQKSQPSVKLWFDNIITPSALHLARMRLTKMRTCESRMSAAVLHRTADYVHHNFVNYLHFLSGV